MYDELIPQNDQQLPELIRLYGSRFRCLCAIAEFSLQLNLTHEQIIQVYDLARQHPSGKVMNDNCLCMQDEHHISKLAFLALKDKNRLARQVGTLQNGIPTGWDGKKVDFDYQILEFKTDTGKHFILANQNSQIIFDPWSTKYSAALKTEKQPQKYLLYKVFKE